jgi:transcription-repair coupling factor (superfamily II helicase)
VGGEEEKKNMFPDDTVYLDGYINENITIDEPGISIIGWGTKREKHIHTIKYDYENYSSYKWGDFITHIDYGVGIYRGLVKKQNKDYIKLEYANNATIHLSAQRLDLIAPLIGTKKPKTSDLGGKAWASSKIKTRKNIQNIICDMIAVNKNSLSRRETPYKKEDYLEGELAASFPYIETGDQASAIMDVYKDMTSPGLMDRLIIGDVGYGKTEIALRAAAKAAFSGVLVMVVVPTTILADQHYILFKNRLEKFGVTVAMLSRFITAKKQKDIIKNLHEKRIDILVGTHKLLSNNIPKKSLGLVIIDEEHKFGVSHKNKLLKIRQGLDVLTLSATQIHGALQQSLLGIRDVTLIQPPPINRLPIKTRVLYKKWSYLKKLVERELFRNGQVYFVHNKIETLPVVYERLRLMFPNINVAMAHGQMPSNKLEEVVLSFFDGNVKILVCTSIIESGLDVTNANTILVQTSILTLPSKKDKTTSSSLFEGI